MKTLGETIMRQGNVQQRQQMESPSSPGTTLFQIYWVIQITVVRFRGGSKVSQFESDPALVKTGICLVMCENEMNSQIYNSSPNVIRGKTRRREERIAFSHLCWSVFLFVLTLLLFVWVRVQCRYVGYLPNGDLHSASAVLWQLRGLNSGL